MPRATQRLRNGGNRRRLRLTSAADPNAKSTKSIARPGPIEAHRRSRKSRSHDTQLSEDDADEGWDRGDAQTSETKAVYSPSQRLPKKSVLELIIDILQRRDAYEAFGEPVDPDEVREYYQVVKEPMDFGTMRAKVHEGMYTSLETFEHDTFLIPLNAMLYNSPSSVHYKQAQAIEELAKRVFHLLKTCPGKLRTDLSETIRRSRRLPPDPEYIIGNSKRGNSPNAKPQNMTTIYSSNRLHKPSMSTSSYADKGFTRSYSLIGGRCSSEDARSTYQPWICFPRESDSIFTTVFRSSKHLEEVRVGEAKMHHRESLTRFARGLGPTAQKIAARKLQPQAKVPTCFRVQLQPATFQYPDISPAQEPPFFPFKLATRSMVNKFPALPSQDPFTLTENAKVRCHVNPVHIGEKLNATTGISTAMTGYTPAIGENGQISGAEKVAAQEGRRGGICLALRSEKYCKRQARTSWRK